MLHKFKKSDKNHSTKAQKKFLDKLNKIAWENKSSIKALAKQGIVVYETEEGTPEKGISKIGGTPDLPASMEWPKFDGQSMTFIAQFNLAQLSDYHTEEDLPKIGWLYFFAFFSDSDEVLSYYKPKSEYCVLYFDGLVSDLRPTDFPHDLPENKKKELVEVEFQSVFFLPPTTEMAVVEQAELSENDLELLMDFDFPLEDGYHGIILGYPIPAQYGVDYSVALSYLDIDLDKGEQEKRQDEIEAVRPQFINLLQIDLFDLNGEDNSYFGIHADDLKNKRFDQAIFVHQSA